MPYKVRKKQRLSSASSLRTILGEWIIVSCRLKFNNALRAAINNCQMLLECFTDFGSRPQMACVGQIKCVFTPMHCELHFSIAVGGSVKRAFLYFIVFRALINGFRNSLLYPGHPRLNDRGVLIN